MENINLVYILGTGTSTGVPTLGCQCDVCSSTDSKNKRFRSSICINFKDGKNILIDTTTDLRSQLLDNNIKDIDAAVITHEHADHTHGIDDLRPFCFYRNHPIPVYTSQNCGDVLKEKYPYIFKRDEVFKDKKILGGGIPKLDLYIVKEKITKILDYDFHFFELEHGHTKTLGFRVDKMAYIIDCNEVPESLLRELKAQNLDLLIIDCLRTKPHSTHLHLDLSIKYAKLIGARQTGLTHLSHEFDHKTLTQQLIDQGMPEIFPLYDTQVLKY